MTAKTLVLQEAIEAMKRAHALFFFEEKHRPFLQRVQPVYVSTARPGITWSHLDAEKVAEYFGNGGWISEDYGTTRLKLVDLVMISVAGLPEIKSEPDRVELISKPLPQLDCVGDDGCKIGLQVFPAGKVSLN